MMKQFIIFTISGLLFFSACQKEEGKGGNSTITGKVFARNYDKSMYFLLDSFYVADEDVYIIYGDDSIYSDKFSTNYDGSFEFKYLRKGTYTIYALSKDLENMKEEPLIPVKTTVRITDSKQTIRTEDLVIIK